MRIDSTPAKTVPDRPDLMRVSKEFETLFLSVLLKEVFKSVAGIGGDVMKMEREIWSGVMTEQLAKSFTDEGMGLRQALYSYLSAQDRPLGVSK